MSPSLEEIMGEDTSKRVESLTPSGLKIEYQSDPRGYWIDGVPVPSVTEVLQILHKPSLIWWGMKVGVDALKTLHDNRVFAPSDLGLSTDEIVKRITEHKLTVNHVRDKAGDRGTSVHMALERWAESGTLPDPEEWPEEEQGYVRGLVAFLTSVDIHPLKSELMVGSAKKSFAGRFDLLAHTEYKAGLKTGPRRTRYVPEGTGIWDLKTGKGIYPDSHFLQLSAYRFAFEECYWDKASKTPARVDYEAIINVREDGTYDIGISDRQPWQFLAVKTAWEALQ